MRLADIDAHSAEARAASILAGLGFDAEAQKRPCSDFSGGWRMRVALAAVLFAEPDLLLLDEPTNYLDLEGAIWLNGFLARYRHTVLVISHDRDLLDEAVDTIIHLDQGKLVVYRGGYSQFERQRSERQALQLKLLKKQQAQRQHLEAFVERFRAKASKAKQAQSRIKALERLAPIAAMVEDRVYPFAIPSPERPMPPPIVAMEDVSVGYEATRPVLTRLDLTLGNDDRVGLLGKNGNGKSTLVKLLAGRLAAQDGRLRRHHKLKIGYFAQHQLDELNPKQSAYDHVRVLLPDATEAQARARAGALGFPGRKMDTPTADLSGGEKARLLLGLTAFEGVDLLILDEPTNHLDIDSREALIRSLNDFSGAVIIVSHDRHLLEATVDQLWLVADGTVRPYEGDLDDYRRGISGTANQKSKAPSVAPAKDRRREAARKREALSPLRAEIRKAERRIEELQGEVRRLDAVLAKPEIYQGNGEEVAGPAKKRADALAALDQAETHWLDLSAKLESSIRAAEGE